MSYKMRMKKPIMILLVFFLLELLTLQVAYAKKKKWTYKCPHTPEDSAAAVELAGELFDEGEELAKKNRFTKSMDKFLCSAAIRDHVNTIFNIAQAARYMRNKKKVLKLLKQYVSENPDAKTSKELLKLIPLIEDKLAKRR